jgi:hypothetical protein
LPEEGIIHHEESHLTGAELFVNFVHESRIKDQKVERTKADKKKERRKHKSDVMNTEAVGQEVQEVRNRSKM